MTASILKHLNLDLSPPTLPYLQELITAYCSTVPWESVSKIIRKDSGTKSPRLEKAFWTSAIEHGTGGTCYESNWAFFHLLQDLGYSGYLTINRMQESTSAHSAIIIIIDNNKYIVDVGYPLYAPIPVTQDGPATLQHSIITYQCTPVSLTEYIIENDPHPKPYLYHLNDIPVTEQAYLDIATSDYGDNGLFSDRIIIRKLINSVPTRFDSEDLPFNIHTLLNGERIRTEISDKDLVKKLSEHFKMDEDMISKAFTILDKTNERVLRS